ncbi:MAG: aminotransferase class III-fold pyridoxal phosphate-dependent enzyme [Luteitalea sp.]|nr:aminotransferase class III-fold pyridoxal phosphate-dependent enzyme [Luteitalea sp.]
MDNYGHFCRPALVPLLEGVGLDARYVKAEGDYLHYWRDGRSVRVLDLLGGYGANLFGHHHPDLALEARRLLDAKVPIHAQASCRGEAGRLAEALCRRLGDFVVTFTNSGAETIEAAIKHVFLERPQRVFWAIKGSFHGKTLGAIQFTWSYRQPYDAAGLKVRFLDPDDGADLDDAFAGAADVAAMLLEPIAGEGGVRPLPPAFVARIRAVCAEHRIPIVADEIQTGMGRTGTFLASEWLGLEPDYVCLGKALGGGLVKIGALLVKRSRYVAEFSLKHTSTFAEDDFSCAVALKALEVLDRDDLMARCSASGGALLNMLDDVRARYPEVIKEVRGKGLMVGIELFDQSRSSHILRMLSQQGHLGYIAAAYMLNVHDVRLAPTLSQALTLRLEPSAYIPVAELQRACDGLEMLCRAISARAIPHLTGFKIQTADRSIREHGPSPRRWNHEAPQSAHRVAFLGHLLVPEDAILLEPSLRAFDGAELTEYLDNSSRFSEPCVFDRVNVRSETGDRVHLSFIGLNLTAGQIAGALSGPDREWIMQKIEAGVSLARAQGDQVVGFGGYTSIISGSCRRVKATGIGLTTGNSLTTGMGILALRQAASELDVDIEGAVLGVIGATGNIASTYAMIMAPMVRELVLVVRSLRSPKLKPLLARIHELAPKTTVRIVESVDGLSRCQLVVAASNVPEPLVFPRHLARGPVAICDISLPSDVSEEVRMERPDVMVIRGGVVRLPHDHDFSIGGVALPPGHALACMAETLLMGLEGLSENGSIGPVTFEGVMRTMEWARKHGFKLGDIHAKRGDSVGVHLPAARGSKPMGLVA